METTLSSLCVSGLILILVPFGFSTSPIKRGRLSYPSSSSICPTDHSVPIADRIACHVAKQNVTDHYSTPVERIVQLYSRASTGHVQIMKTGLDALGQDGSAYARLVLESDNFGRIKIKREKTNRYICLSKKGDLVIRVKKQKFAAMRRCIFKEEMTGDGYFQYRSVRYPQWYIGFSKGGRPRHGSKSAKRAIYRHFTIRNTPDRRRHTRREARIKRIIKWLRKRLRKA
ncbi:fibroblast growth factor 18-like isoform X2 [Stylophora pistillata]|uniref:Fibroblast growth factor 8 n=1 Tax=Stylophora pistillata TaxID=50429 RepID=A0A2B4SRB6_STYPI|nr:fibroblast growth factor 18-like isoform X2 [Stylophora pistillata]PFX31072.1 Fibroblast growth factor 8 [Stylophora pistillata]